MKRLLLVLLGLAGLVALLYAATLSQASFECEACIEYAGRGACRTVVAPTRREAEQLAVSTACSLAAQGVTDELRCQRSVPRSLSCRER